MTPEHREIGQDNVTLLSRPRKIALVVWPNQTIWEAEHPTGDSLSKRYEHMNFNSTYLQKIQRTCCDSVVCILTALSCTWSSHPGFLVDCGRCRITSCDALSHVPNTVPSSNHLRTMCGPCAQSLGFIAPLGLPRLLIDPGQPQWLENYRKLLVPLVIEKKPYIYIYTFLLHHPVRY